MNTNNFYCPKCGKRTMHVQISAREWASIDMKRQGCNAFTKGFISTMIGFYSAVGVEAVASGITGKRCFKCCECGEAHVRNQDGSYVI